MRKIYLTTSLNLEDLLFNNEAKNLEIIEDSENDVIIQKYNMVNTKILNLKCLNELQTESQVKAYFLIQTKKCQDLKR